MDQADKSTPGIDIDEAADTTLGAAERPAPSVTMDDLDQVIRRTELLPHAIRHSRWELASTR